MAQSRTDMFVLPQGGEGEVQPAPAGDLKLSNYLGILREAPDDVEAMSAVQLLAESQDTGRLGEEPQRLLQVAREGHEARGEWSAVAAILGAEVALRKAMGGDPLPGLKQLGKIRLEHLLDPEGARAAYEEARATADDSEVADALKRMDQAEGGYRRFAERYMDEAAAASDNALKASLLVQAAALVWQYRKKGRSKESEGLLRSALEADPGHLRAIETLEHTLRQRERYEELAELLEQGAAAVGDDRDRRNLHARAARVYARQRGDQEKAIANYRKVLVHDPADTEALSYLAQVFADLERWDDLIALYEAALRVRHKLEVEQALLLQIGMVHFRMCDQVEMAEPYFARLRKLEPGHPAVLEFYRTYYHEDGQTEALLQVLSDAQRLATSPEVRLGLALEIARRAQDHPQLTDRAIDAWKVVLRIEPTHAEATEVLKRLYAKSSKWNALVEVLRNEVEALPNEQIPRKVELLRELAAIYGNQLRMDGMVINTYNAILKLVPDDPTTLAELRDRYRALGRWSDLVTVLNHEAEGCEDSDHAVALYLEIAQLWIEHSSNYNQATLSLERVVELRPDNRRALDQLKEIYQNKRAWRSLFEVLRREREASADPVVRLRNAEAMARLSSERLQRHAEAIALWREVVAEEPTREGALDALERLSEREKDYPTQADVLERRLATAHEPQLRVQLLQKLGSLYADCLDLPERAREAFREILKLDPKHSRALRSLRDSLIADRDYAGVEALYGGVGDWESLVEVLTAEADRVDERELKVELSFRAARVFREELSEPLRALRSYERVLSVDPSNAEANEAVLPIYEAEEKWSRVATVLQRLLEASPDDDSERRLPLLAQLSELSLRRLRDPKSALAHAEAAYRLAPQRTKVIARLESVAEAAGAYSSLVDLYVDSLESATGEHALGLRRKIAVLAADRLGDLALAAQQYQAILQDDPEDREVLLSLERLQRVRRDEDGLIAVLSQRLELDKDLPTQMALLRELAGIEEGREQLEQAATYYRRMAELEPTDDDVLAARDRLAQAAGRDDELAEILRCRINISSGRSSRVELGSRLGQLLLGSLADTEGALDVFLDVLHSEPGHGPTLATLEKLAEQHKDLRPRILPALATSHEGSGRYDKLTAVLSQQLELESDPAQEQRLRLRIAEIAGEKLGDASGAYAALEAAFLRQPGKREYWERLERAAARADQQAALAEAFATAIASAELDSADLVDLSRATARLYDEVLSLPDRAEAFHRRVLDAEPLDEVAFEALKNLCTSKERWQDLQLLYRTRLKDTIDPQARVELLLESCFLYEEILEEPTLAIEGYGAVLELVPDHGPALRNLERLYELTERHRDLADTLRRHVECVTGPDRIELMFRLGQVLQSKLGEPEAAVDEYENILALQPTHLRSQEALSGLLDVEAVRPRVATMLEPIYDSQGAYRELCQVLEIQLEGDHSSAARVDLLMRVGEIEEQRLRDLDAAFSAFARAAEVDPLDEGPREAMAAVIKARPDLARRNADVLGRLVERMQGGSPHEQARLLSEHAHVLLELLGEEEAAERVYERLIALDPKNAEHVVAATQALERIHLARKDIAAVAMDLERRLELEPEPEVRIELWARLAEYYEQVLEQPARALSACRSILDLDPSDDRAAERQCRLLTAEARWPELVDALRARADGVQDHDLRRDLVRSACQLLEEELDDEPAAIDAYVEFIANYGPDHASLMALAGLYERTEAFPDLIDVLQQLQSDASDAERPRLQFRMAEVMRSHTQQLHEAIGLYEAVLSQVPDHAGSLAALHALMDKEFDVQIRTEAARVAIPRFEETGAHEPLLSALHVQAAGDDPELSLRSLRRAAAVAAEKLHQPGRGFDILQRALSLDLADDDLRRTLTDLGQLARDSKRQADFVAMLQQVVDQVLSDTLQVEIWRTVATVSRAQLADNAGARAAFQRLLELEPTDRAALSELEELTEEAGDYLALVEVLRRRAELETDQAARAALLFHQADIHERLDETDKAIAVLEDLAAEAPLLRVYEALERLYGTTQRFDDLVDVFERQLGAGVGERVELRYRIAAVSYSRLQDVPRALSVLKEALAEDSDHGRSVVLLETLMEEATEFRAEAAEILEPGYLARMEWSKLTAALEAQLQAQTELGERKRLLVRLAQIYEDQLEDFAGTFELYARLLREDPHDEEVWDRLHRLARVDGRFKELAAVLRSALGDAPVMDETLAKLAKYTGRIYEERLSDHGSAARCFEFALEYDSGDREAFTLIESAYRNARDHDALLRLYREQADHLLGQERVQLLHKRAQLLRAEPARAREAIAAYRELLDLEPSDARASTALDELLVAVDDRPALAEHLRHRIHHEPHEAKAIALKLRLVDLLRAGLDDLSGAIDLLEDITTDHPAQPEALALLEELVQGTELRLRLTQILEPIYRHLDQWKKLVAVYEAQVELQADPAEQVRLLSDVARLHEGRGRDPRLALDAYGRALIAEPDNGPARAAVDRLVGLLGCWDELVRIYEAALLRAPDSGTKIALLTTVARVQDERLGDPRAAIAAYEALLEEDPLDPTPLDALEALLMLVSDWAGLVWVFERKIALSFDPSERSELLRRIAAVQEDLLRDPDAAIATYHRATAEDDADDLSFQALDRLYTKRSAAEPLGEVLRRRLELALMPEDRVELGLRLGALLHHHLHQPDDAIIAYRKVLEEDGENAAAIAELSRLFERQGKWSELVSNLRLQLQLDPPGRQRADHLLRIAQVVHEELGDPLGAVEYYAEALQEVPDHEPSIESLMALASDEGLRPRVIELLDPLLRSQRRFDDLVRLSEQALSSLSDRFDRRRQLIAIAELHERGRRAPGDAFSAYGRALSEDPADIALHRELERLAQSEGKYQELSLLFEKCASQISQPEDASLLLRHAGRIHEEVLEDPPAAIRAYAAASERDDDATETLSALDRLYQRTQAFEPLLEVLERRVAAAEDEASRIELLLRLGDLLETRFDDSHGAFVAYREVLELSAAEPNALAGMERLGQHDHLAQDVLDILHEAYRDSGSPEKVVGLYDIRARLAATTTERVRVLREAAVIWEQELRDSARALSTLAKAFEVDPFDDDVLTEMERLAGVHRLWPSMKGFVERVVDEHREEIDPYRARELCLRAAEWYRERLEDPEAEERMLRRVLIDAPQLDSVQRRLLELVRVEGRQADLVAALCAWGRVESNPDARADRYREAASLAESALGDKMTAAECLEWVLSADPDDVASLDALIRISSDLGRHRELISLLAKRTQLADTEDERLALLHRTAQLHAGPLSNREHAVTVYRRILEREPGDEAAYDALAELFLDADRRQDLAALIAHRIEHAPEVEQRVAARLRLAELQERHFSDFSAAVEQLRAVLATEPRHAFAFAELSRLYETSERYPELSLLLSKRVTLSEKDGDRQGEIDCLQRLCALYDGPLRDRDNALIGYTRLNQLEPDDVDYLQALVRLHRAAGHWQETASALAQLLERSQEDQVVDVALQLAEVSRRHLKQPERAQDALRRALGIAPERQDVRNELRKCYAESGAAEQLAAMLDEDERREADPEVKVALLKEIAELYRGPLAQPAGAVPYLERAQALAPNDRDVLLVLCDIYMSADRHADAVEVLQSIVDSYGGRRTKEVALFEHRLGQALEGIGRLDEAFEHYDAAFKIDLTNVSILRDLGRVCMERGDLARAQKSYRALLLQRLGPEAGIRKADVYFYLGQISHRQGDLSKARTMLQRAVSEAGAHEEAAALLATL